MSLVPWSSEPEVSIKHDISNGKATFIRPPLGSRLRFSYSIRNWLFAESMREAEFMLDVMDALQVWVLRKLRLCKHKNILRNNTLVNLSIYNSNLSTTRSGLDVKVQHCATCNRLFMTYEGSIDAILNQPDE